jgi:riboflavin synthase
MFTGLVEGQGAVYKITPDGEDAMRLDIEFPQPMIDGLAIGDSVAISGCCLTVIAIDGRVVAFQAGSETLSKTILGTFIAGESTVNLERSLAANARLGGHFVQGHVDGQGEIHSIDRDGEWITMWFSLPESLAKFLVPKGSIAINGISLTVVDVVENRFSVALIPHTLEVTTLGKSEVGDPVNLETDILGKYIDRLLQARGL